MKKIFIFVGVIFITGSGYTQNIGIGIKNPTRAKFEVWGASGIGNTTALFGGDRGISLQRNYAGIGFNQYRDDINPSTYGRYMGPGYASVWQYIHEDPTQTKGLSLTMYPSGSTNAQLPVGNRLWNFTSNSRLQIQSDGIGGNGILDVGRGVSNDGTAVFMGTTYWSHFNYSSTEDTYIRGGKGPSNVVINDMVGGKVIFGNGGTTVGVNTNYYTPPTTLEVRQSNGGLELTNSTFPNEPLEWRVANGSPANFYLYYINSVRTYFSYVDGSLHPISDARVKTNIESLEPVMPKLMLLKPVTYMMKDAKPGQPRSMGFIAQEVAPLFPTLISSNMDGSSDLLGLNYNAFNVIAVKGIQEEQEQINDLEIQLDKAEIKMAAIEKKLNITNK